jgi:hypothetical protein
MGNIATMLDRNSINATALVAVWMTIATSAAGTEMKYPDWESQWRNPAADRGGIPWNPSKPMGLAQQAPLTPEYQAIFEASLKDQAAGGRGNDFTNACTLAGMPRIMSLAAPMEILIEPTFTHFIFQTARPRHIPTDGRVRPADEPPAFQGHSLGKWIDEDGDGRYDVLEVETLNLAGPRAFDSSGLPFHDDNQTVVKERIFLDKDNTDILHNVITTIDNALARPWTVHKTYVRERNPRWTEYNCQVPKNHIFIDREEYLLSADGKLMPVRAGQLPPDLQYFKQPQK